MIAKKNKKYLIVKTNSDSYLIPLNYILFIEKIEYNSDYVDERIKRLPDSPAFVTGVIRLKKTTFPVLEMEQILNANKTKIHNENKIVFIKYNEHKFGLFFNDVVEIAPFNFEDDDLKLNNSKPIYINSIENLNYFLIDIKKLVSSKGFNSFLSIKD